MSLDTGIVSAVSSGLLEPLADLMRHRNWQTVVSETTIRELMRGRPNGEIDYLRKNNAVVLSNFTEIHPDGSVPALTLDEVEPASGIEEALEIINMHFLRLMSESKSVVSIEGDYIRLVEEISEWFRLNPVGTEDEARLRSLLLEAKSVDLSDAVLRDSQRLRESDPMENHGAGPLRLSNVRPPDVILSALSLLGDQAAQELRDLFAGYKTLPDQREAVRMVYLLASSIGLFGDKRVRKENVSKSIRGALSQYNDAATVSSTLGTNMFLTMDTDCAMLSYSVFEFLSKPTLVGLVEDCVETGAQMRIIGTDTWPVGKQQ